MLTTAEGKSGTIAHLHQFPSQMAQTFWIAIFAWSTCMLMTFAINLATRPHTETQLRGLIYGLTETPHDHGVSWYQPPVPLAVIVAVALVFLNLLFR